MPHLAAKSVLIVAYSLFFTGCASPNLQSLEKTPAASFRHKAHKDLAKDVIRLQVRTINRKAIYLALHEWKKKNPARAHKRLIVMVHGVMSDNQSWRLTSAEIAMHGDIIAVDLMGCGQSDKPSPKQVGPKGYCPDALACDVLAALEQYLKKNPQYEKITFVGHSLGSMAILRMWTNEATRTKYNTVLSRVDGQVLLTPIDVIMEEIHPHYFEVATASELKWTLARASGLLRHRVIIGIHEGVTDPRRAYHEEFVRVIQILNDRQRRLVMQAMILQAVPIDLINQKLNYVEARKIEKGYKSVSPPTLIVWGARDHIFPQSMGYKVMSQLPTSRLFLIEEGKHDLPMEWPEIVSSKVIDFINKGIDTHADNHGRDRTTRKLTIKTTEKNKEGR